MKCFIGIDPGRSGGYAIAFDSLDSVELHNLTEEGEFVRHLLELVDNPDIESIEASLEDCPPFAGKNIPSSAGFKLGYSCGFSAGVLRALQVPVTLIKPKVWQAGLGGLTGLTGAKRKRVLKDHAYRFFPKVTGLTLKTADAILILRHFLLTK
jgi:hypothetical protein